MNPNPNDTFNLWMRRDPPNKRILFLCERKRAIEILSLFLGNSLSQAVKELSTINYMAPSPYVTQIKNPEHPSKESPLRLDFTLLAPDMGNSFQMARNYGYGGDLQGKFWGVLTTTDDNYDIYNAWPWLIGGLENIKS